MYMNPTINPQATGLQVFYNENENVSIRTDVIGYRLEWKNFKLYSGSLERDGKISH